MHRPGYEFMVSDWQLMRIHYQGGCDFAGSHVFGGASPLGARMRTNALPAPAARPLNWSAIH